MENYDVLKKRVHSRCYHWESKRCMRDLGHSSEEAQKAGRQYAKVNVARWDRLYKAEIDLS